MWKSGTHIALLVLAFALTGCKDEKGKKEETKAEKEARETRDIAHLPESSGSTAEVVVVMDEGLRETRAHRILKKLLQDSFPGLPQSEERFRAVYVNTDAFKGSLRRNHSVLLLVENDKGLDSTLIGKHRYAYPQTFVRIDYSDREGLIAQVSENGRAIRRAFHRRSLALIKKRHRQFARVLPENTKKLGISRLYIPKSFKPDIDKPEIQTFWHRTNRYDQVLLIYSRPMSGNYTVGADLIHVRDSICALYVPGQVEGSHMITETEFPPDISEMTLDGQIMIEMRGLWKTEGDFMGGPFLSRTVYDENNGQILTIEGFVFGPRVDKRNLMLEIEAILDSVVLE